MALNPETSFAAAPVTAPLLALACVFAWKAAIYLDGSALTAGTVQAADPVLRGASMGPHSTAGHAGGFVGPPLCGAVLNLAGADGPLAWGLALGHVAPITLAGIAVLRRRGRMAERFSPPAKRRGKERPPRGPRRPPSGAASRHGLPPPRAAQAA